MAIIKSPKVISTPLGLRNLSAIPREIPDLSDYTKHTLPWKTGTTGNIYIYTNTKSNTVYIGSDENQELTERSQVIRFRTTTPGVTTGAQAVAELNVIQSEAVYSYELVVNVPTQNFFASGGTTQVSSTLKTYRNDVLISTGAVNPTFKLHGGDEGKGITVSSTGLVTAADRGTTVGDERVVHIQASTKDTYTKEEVQVSFQVTQQANQISYDNPVVNLTVPLVPAKGGSVSSGTVSYTQKVKYTSGASQSLNSGGQVTYSSSVSGSNLGTTEKSQTKLGTLTATVSMNGKRGSATKEVFQQANVATYGPVTAGNISVSGDIPASGGSRTATLTAGSQTVTYTSEATRAGKVTSSQSAAISGSNLGVTAKVRSKVGSITGTWTGEGSKSATKSVSIYQALNKPVELIGNADFILSSATSPASGSNITITMNGGAKIKYSSGSTTSSEINAGQASGGSLSYARENSVSSIATLSGTTVIVPSRTTVLGEARDITVTSSIISTLVVDSSLGGGTLSDKSTTNKTITQEANRKTTITYGDITIQTATTPDIPASGGTANTGSVTYQQIRSQNYTSGSREPIAPLGSGLNVSWDSVTIPSKGTTASERTDTGKDITVTVSGNGKYATKSVDVYQALNRIENSNYQPAISAYGTPTVSIGNGLTAAGGSATVTASVTNTESYKQLYTSGSTTSHTRSKAGSVTLSMTVNGNSRFSFTSPTISHSSMTTNLTTDTVTITATNAGSTSKTATASKSITNTRKPKSTSGGGITYENVVIGTITNAVIPASGGTAVAKAGNGTQKWTKAAGQTTYIYDSGSEKIETTTASTSGTDQVTPSISELSGTASSKGTTISGVTTVKSSTVTWTGGGDKSASGTMTVTQAANAVVKTTSSNGAWTGTLSTNKTTAAASADSINVTFGAIKRTITYTDTYTSTAIANRTATDYYSGTAYVRVTTEKDGAKVSDWSPTSLSYTNSSSTTTKTISKASYGTTLRNSGSVDFDLYADDTYVRVYQRISVAANTVSYSTPSVTNNYPESAPAGDYWSTRVAYSQTATYTSGSTTTISSGGTVTYAVGTPATGWTLETSTGKITVDNNKSSSTRTATNFVKTTVVLNGKTGTCYSSPVQAAGAKQYGSWSVSISANTTSISAAGGSATISSSASRPWTWNGVSGSGGTVTDTPALSLVTANGSSLSSSTLTFPSRGTTEGSARSATVRATYSGITKDVTVTQAANTKSVSQGTPSISLSANTQTIAYSGGSSTITYSASRTDTYTYTSGSKTTTPVSLTSSVSISGSSTGFTISGTTAGTRTVTATENIGVLDRSITVRASLPDGTSKKVTITQGTGPYIKAKYGEVVQMYRGEVSSQIKDIVGAWKQ